MKKSIIFCLVLFVCLSLSLGAFAQSCSLSKSAAACAGDTGGKGAGDSVDEFSQEKLPQIKPENLQKEIQTEIVDEQIVDAEA